MNHVAHSFTALPVPRGQEQEENQEENKGGREMEIKI